MNFAPLSFRALSLALCAAFLSTGTARAQQRANVLVVLADDLGVDYVTCYGEGTQPARTPTIDALAARGILFRNAWAHPSCSPTRAALLTGRHPSRTYVGRWIRHEANTEPIGTLRASEWTLPEVLDLAGNGTAHACIGKWHLHDGTYSVDSPRTIGGFAHYAGFLAGQLPSYTAWPRVVNGVSATSTTYATTQQVDDTLAWIGAQTEPWVCYLAFNAPHLPFEAPPAHLHSENLAGTTPTNNSRGYYRAMIEAMDRELGRLLTSLGPELDHTWIVFLGDNGSVQNQAVAPFLASRAKGTPYEGGLNVPLIVAGPGVVSPGREASALACSVDIFPTVLELAGALPALPTWIEQDGISLVPYFANAQQTPLRTFAWSEEFTGAAWPTPTLNGHACVRDDRYKLIYRVNGSREFFDLQLDPFERTNLLGGTLSAPVQARYAALLGEIARIRTPLARVLPLDTPSCLGTNGTPRTVASSLPRLGTNFVIELDQAAPSSPAVHLLGWSATSWSGISLPLDLGPVGFGAGCLLRVAPDLLFPSATDASGRATFGFPIPNEPRLAEATCFQTWLIADANAPGTVGWVVASAVATRVGL